MRNRSQGRDARREAAVKRQELREQRSVVEQRAVLDARLGVGSGAARERARLAVQR